MWRIKSTPLMSANLWREYEPYRAVKRAIVELGGRPRRVQVVVLTLGGRMDLL